MWLTKSPVIKIFQKVKASKSTCTLKISKSASIRKILEGKRLKRYRIKKSHKAKTLEDTVTLKSLKSKTLRRCKYIKKIIRQKPQKI